MEYTFGKTKEAQILNKLLKDNPIFMRTVSRSINDCFERFYEISNSNLNIGTKNHFLRITLKDYQECFMKKEITSTIITFSLNIIKQKYKKIIREVNYG